MSYLYSLTTESRSRFILASAMTIARLSQIFICLVVMLQLNLTNADAMSQMVNLSFDPASLEVFRIGYVRNLTVSIASVESTNFNFLVESFCEDEYLCDVVDGAKQWVNLNDGDAYNQNITIAIKAKYLGFTNVRFRINNTLLDVVYELSLLRSDFDHMVGNVFTVFITIFVTGITFLMGTQLQLRCIAGIARKPVGPLVGAFCQFGIQPVVAYFMARFIIPDNQYAIKFALFAAGCSPGGGKSSFWTIIFGGNLDLSVSMTFTQTVSAVFMMPLWIYTVGQTFLTGRAQVPFVNLLESLLLLIIPSIGGMVFIHYNQHLTKRFNYWIKALTWTATLIFTVFGVYANLYVVHLFTWRIVICGCVLPWSGYITAYLVACLTRQSHRDAITIAIETGCQNIGICAVMLMFSFPEPERDIAMVMPIAIVLATDKPLIIIWLIRKIRQKFCTPKKVVESGGELSPTKLDEKSPTKLDEKSSTKLDEKSPTTVFHLGDRTGSALTVFTTVDGTLDKDKV